MAASRGKSPIDRSNHVPRNFANYSGVISFARKKVLARRASSDRSITQNACRKRESSNRTLYRAWRQR